MILDSTLIRDGGAVVFDADQPDRVDGQVIVDIWRKLPTSRNS